VSTERLSPEEEVDRDDEPQRLPGQGHRLRRARIDSHEVDGTRRAACTWRMTHPTGSFPVTTALELPGLTIQRNLGVAFGLVVRSMGLARGITAGVRALRQGEVPEYTSLLEDSRRHAMDRMIENARLLGANAVVSMRFDSSEIGQQLTEIVAYGSAVVVVPAS
jgi:uncharacterized protein YbjQ (UPF0145 family)